RSTWETCRGAVMPTPSTPPRARVTSSGGARPIDRSSTSPTGTARSRRACRASRASPAARTTTTCCRFGRKASISRSSTPARGSSAKRLTGWCCARRRGEGSPAAGPSLDHQMAGAPLRRRAEGGHEHLDLRRLRVGGPAIGADVRPAAGAALVFLEEREVGTGLHAGRSRRARLLGAERLPHAGRSVAGRAVWGTGAHPTRYQSAAESQQEARLREIYACTSSAGDPGSAGPTTP